MTHPSKPAGCCTLKSLGSVIRTVPRVGQITDFRNATFHYTQKNIEKRTKQNSPFQLFLPSKCTSRAAQRCDLKAAFPILKPLLDFHFTTITPPVPGRLFFFVPVHILPISTTSQTRFFFFRGGGEGKPLSKSYKSWISQEQWSVIRRASSLRAEQELHHNCC